MKIRYSLPSMQNIIVAATIAMLIISSEHARTQPCLSGRTAIAVMENKSVSTQRSKCGYPECQQSTPPKVFLKKTQVTLKFAAVNGVATEYITLTENLTKDSQHAYPSSGSSSCALWEAPETDSCNGTCSDGSSSAYAPPCSWSDQGTIFNNINPYLSYDFGLFHTVHQCTSTVSEDTYDSGVVTTTCPPGTWQHYIDTTTTLETEYTDDMLVADIKKDSMPAYPGWTLGSGTAFLKFMDGSHICASAGKMQYRVKIPHSAKGVTYLIVWNELTTYYPTGVPSYVLKHDQITGTGDPVNPAIGPIHTVNVPRVLSTIQETPPIATIVSAILPGN
jgi:hypothetical protein